MEHSHDHYYKPEQQVRWWKRPSGMAAIFFFGAAGYFLVTEHWAHIVPFLPWLIIILCPLIHLFHHGAHGSHGGHSSRDEEEK
ncbi:MAG TPA: DUF2933 domain-containing protein [Thermodesulfobacteriota bacterium]|nr:DUF2933 domain-containing protein [Thermodesulfobacteriota bacterium]